MTVPAAVTVDYVNNPYWLFHLSIRGVMRQMLDGNDRPLYDRGDHGEPNTIDNFPYVISQRMPSAAGLTAGDDYAIFGDLEMSHYFGMLGNIDVATSSEVYFDKDMTAIRGLMHIACERIDAAAVKRCQLHS
jgi:HK97 family phage major capsid protein